MYQNFILFFWGRGVRWSLRSFNKIQEFPHMLQCASKSLIRSSYNGACWNPCKKPNHNRHS